ncbi:MAG TPA: hypothetical protein VD731_04455 [Nitrosopumilaceae archaeon]|nr:hypothetical protein [Nitrosopumilaceae archaeon]
MKKSKFLLFTIIVFVFTSMFVTSTSFADVISPKKQMNLKISIADVVCDERFVKVIKVSTGNPSCVTPTTAEKLIKNGWAKEVDQKLIDDAKMEKPSIGTVTKLATVQVKGTAGTQTPKIPIIGYDFVFEVCALGKTIYAPEILVKSDSAAQRVELATNIDANTCQTSSIIVKASNPDSITGTLVNTGGISANIVMLETKISDLSQKLESEKKILNDLVKVDTKSADSKAKIAESNQKIIQLRQELNDARADYSRFLFVIFTNPSKSSATTKFSFSGTPIEGAQATKLSVIPQVSGEGYNVVFEACAGTTAVRAPLITVKSDIESKDVVLANRISPNSCQLGTGQLKASNEDSIQVIFGNTEDFSKKVTDLENQITTWQADLATAKRSLAELVKTAQKPANYEEQVNTLTQTIVDLRNSINNAKAALQGAMLDYYE